MADMIEAAAGIVETSAAGKRLALMLTQAVQRIIPGIASLGTARCRPGCRHRAGATSRATAWVTLRLDRNLDSWARLRILRSKAAARSSGRRHRSSPTLRCVDHRLQISSYGSTLTAACRHDSPARRWGYHRGPGLACRVVCGDSIEAIGVRGLHARYLLHDLPFVAGQHAFNHGAFPSDLSVL